MFLDIIIGQIRRQGELRIASYTRPQTLLPEGSRQDPRASLPILYAMSLAFNIVQPPISLPLPHFLTKILHAHLFARLPFVLGSAASLCTAIRLRSSEAGS